MINCCVRCKRHVCAACCLQLDRQTDRHTDWLSVFQPWTLVWAEGSNSGYCLYYIDCAHRLGKVRAITCGQGLSVCVRVCVCVSSRHVHTQVRALVRVAVLCNDRLSSGIDGATGTWLYPNSELVYDRYWYTNTSMRIHRETEITERQTDRNRQADNTHTHTHTRKTERGTR